MRIYEDKDARMKKLISLSRVNIMLFGGYKLIIILLFFVGEIVMRSLKEERRHFN